MNLNKSAEMMSVLLLFGYVQDEYIFTHTQTHIQTHTDTPTHLNIHTHTRARARMHTDA